MLHIQLYIPAILECKGIMGFNCSVDRLMSKTDRDKIELRSRSAAYIHNKITDPEVVVDWDIDHNNQNTTNKNQVPTGTWFLLQICTFKIPPESFSYLRSSQP
jgi:hypothetical protein